MKDSVLLTLDSEEISRKAQEISAQVWENFQSQS